MKVRFERVEKSRPVLRPQVRQHDPAYLTRLAESLDKGQLQPIGLLAKDFTVIWGNARVLAARMNPAVTHLMAAIFDEEITEREFQRLRFVENHLRQNLSNAEKCQNAVEYARSGPNLSLKQIAQDLGVDPSLLTRWMAWEKVIEPVRQALASDAITLQSLYAISQQPQDQQQVALTEALAAPNTAVVTSTLRRKRNGNGENETVRLSRVKCPLPSGVHVTVAGKNLSISDFISALSDLLKEAKRAADQGLDIRTLAAVTKDKAKKG